MRNHCLLSLAKVSLVVQFDSEIDDVCSFIISLAKLSRNELVSIFLSTWIRMNIPMKSGWQFFQTNAVAAGDGVGIFPTMARINHGCSSAFNAVYTWREKDCARA